MGGSWLSLPTLGLGGQPAVLASITLISCPSLVSGEKSVQLVMEYMPLGSLRDYLPRHNVGLVQLLLFSLQICEVGQPAPTPRTCPLFGLA